tara:strand:- start:1824 stop:2573 length:750 start_codon:yes stop_codon:yes gene_type:complete
MKLVSIIIPYFRNREYLAKTISSITNQTYKKIEILVVYDDNDQNDLRYFKKKFKLVKNLKFLVNKSNIGAGLSRNRGICKSKGYFLAFIDSDDYWHKDKLKKQINFMEKNNFSLTHTSYKIIDKNGNLKGLRKAKKKLKHVDLLKSCDVGLSTVVLKKSIIKNNNCFPNLKTKEDYVFWLNLTKNKFIFYGLNEYLANWRRLDGSLSSSSFQKIKDGFKVYNTFMNYNFFKSLFYLLRLSLNFFIKKLN